jgi:hypothetical protein
MPKLLSTNKAVTVSVLQNNMYESNNSSNSISNNNNPHQINLVKTRTVYSGNELNNNHFHHLQQQQQQPQQQQWQNNELPSEFIRALDLEKNYIVKLKNVTALFTIIISKDIITRITYSDKE